MPRIEVIAAIEKYLNLGMASGEIPSVSTIYPYPPKIVKQTALYDAQPPGTADGAVIYMYLSGQRETRISTDGPHNGRKGRTYKLSLICYFRWLGKLSEEAGRNSDAFIDGLTAWIQADRNAGTEAVSLGGDGSGTIFSWGEGPGPDLTGDDIIVNSMMPRDFGGQTSQVFSIVEVEVVEILNT